MNGARIAEVIVGSWASENLRRERSTGKDASILNSWTGLSITNMTSKQHTIFINDESPYEPERMVRVKLSDIKHGTIFEKHWCCWTHSITLEAQTTGTKYREA